MGAAFLGRLENDGDGAVEVAGLGEHSGGAEQDGGVAVDAHRLGVQHDGESARSIARKMGVKDANMRHYKDGELTLAGMQRAFDELQERIADGDQVFIYFSGHGGRYERAIPQPADPDGLDESIELYELRPRWRPGSPSAAPPRAPVATPRSVGSQPCGAPE